MSKCAIFNTSVIIYTLEYNHYIINTLKQIVKSYNIKLSSLSLINTSFINTSIHYLGNTGITNTRASIENSRPLIVPMAKANQKTSSGPSIRKGDEAKYVSFPYSKLFSLKRKSKSPQRIRQVLVL